MRELQRKIQTMECELQSSSRPTLGGNNTRDFDTKIQVVERQIDTFEKCFAVFLKEIQRNQQMIETLKRQLDETRVSLEDMDRKFREIARASALKDITIQEHELRMGSLENISYSGKFVWKVSDFRAKRQEALVGKVTSIYSPSFYTSRTGMKIWWDSILSFMFKQTITY